MKAIALLSAAIVSLWASSANAMPVASEEAACALTQVRVAARDGFSAAIFAPCDVITPDDSPPGFYVLALHSRRLCRGICSTNMGWFAVQRSTGRVFEWDVGEERLGRAVSTWFVPRR